MWNMSSWTPLWSQAVESSLWDEPDAVVKVFLTMMALKDEDHVCRYDAYALARKSRKTEVEVLEILKILASPDTKKLTPQPFEGRRIQAVEGGWLILNGEKYREMVQREMKRRRDARAARAYRERQKEKKHQVTPQELQHEKISNEQGPEAANAYFDEQQNKGAI